MEIKNLKLEKQKHEKEEKEEDLDLEKPLYLKHIDLTDEQEKRLVNEIMDEIDYIEDQRSSIDLENKWKKLQDQYDSQYTDDPVTEFDIFIPTTKNKLTTINNDIMEAFFADQIYTVSPFPDFSTDKTKEIAEKQEDFLQTKLETIIPFEEEIEKACLSAQIKGIGILKFYHEIDQETKIRESFFKANLEVIRDATGEPLVLQFKLRDYDEIELIPVNKGIQEFLNMYQQDMDFAIKENNVSEFKKYISYIKDLANGKDVYLEETYLEVTYNDPKPKFIYPENLYVRIETEKYYGLCRTRLIAEKIEYSYWELKQKEKEREFRNIDDIIYNEDGKTKRDKYRQIPYTVYECTYYFDMDENEKERKIKVWIEKESRKIIGAIEFQWFGFKSEYVPFYVKNEQSGFYEKGIAEDNRSLNIVENTIVNFILEAAFMSNTITPIVDRESSIISQFFNKRWAHGIPLMTDKDESPIRFLNEFMRPADISGLVLLKQLISRESDDATKVSSGRSGRESAFDPSAPAAKTIALLEQTNKDIRAYIKKLLPSFNLCASILLNMYYQISKEGRKYKPKKSDKLFETLTRSEMIARTNIESRAYSFNFERQNAQKIMIAVYQTIRSEPIIASNPQAVYFLIRTLIKSMSGFLKVNVDKLMPDPEAWDMRINQVITETTYQYFLSKEKEAAELGVKPNLDVNELKSIINATLSNMVTPSNEEIKKAG